MSLLTVALLQLRSDGADPESAWAAGQAACRRAAEMGADIALFPEMHQIGYQPCPDLEPQRSEWLDLSVEKGGAYVGRYQRLARELGIAIVATYLERCDAGVRNAATLIDAHGASILHYAKVHTCDFGMEAVLEPGDGFRVGDLDTPAGRVRIGLMICYDREFPEAARSLMLQGAEVILVPNSCYMSDDRIGQLRARAFENMVGVALTNYASQGSSAGFDGCNGKSAAFSGICFDENGAPIDQELLVADGDSAVHTVTFDLAALRRFRSEETWGDAFRKPWAYGDLADTRPPLAIFARPESRRGVPHVD